MTIVGIVPDSANLAPQSEFWTNSYWHINLEPFRINSESFITITMRICCAGSTLWWLLCFCACAQWRNEITKQLLHFLFLVVVLYCLKQWRRSVLIVVYAKLAPPSPPLSSPYAFPSLPFSLWVFSLPIPPFPFLPLPSPSLAFP